MLFSKRTLYLGYSTTDFNRIRDILDANQIKYSYKVRNRLTQFQGTHGTVRGHTGSAGINLEKAYEYEIKISEKEFDMANHLIQK